jgi:hypothetical protein
LQKHCAGHRADPARVGAEETGDFSHAGVNIAHQGGFAVIPLNAGDANVERCGTRFDPLGLDEVGNADGGHHNVGSANGVFDIER